MWRNFKFLHMWRNFPFPYNCHTWKAENFPHGNFLSTNNINDISDKYQVNVNNLDEHSELPDHLDKQLNHLDEYLNHLDKQLNHLDEHNPNLLPGRKDQRAQSHLLARWGGQHLSTVIIVSFLNS